MKSKVLAVLVSVSLLATIFVGCGKTETTETTGTEVGTTEEVKEETTETTELENVTLVMWGAEEDQVMLGEMIESFKTFYADKAVFDISLGVQSESTAKDTVLTDVEAAADVFAFADDQLNELVNAGACASLFSTRCASTG